MKAQRVWAEDLLISFDLSQIACFLPYKNIVLLRGLSFFLKDLKACLSALSMSVPVESVLLTLVFCTSASDGCLDQSKMI